MSKKREAALTEEQRLFLRTLRDFQKKRREFTYRDICTVMGWSSVNSSWEMVEKLVAAGFVRRGQMLAHVEAPVLTTAGLRQLRRAA